jgi:HSP20 family molecular chaperone IbpA
MAPKVKHEDDSQDEVSLDGESADSTPSKNPPGWSVHAYQTYYVWRTPSRLNPPTDVIELADRVVVLIEIAGLHRNEIHITLLNRKLTISGERTRPALNGGAYHQAEIGYGHFRVEINTPWAVERDAVTAIYRDGLLQIELPHKPETRIHIVDVNGEHSEDVSDDGIEDGNSHHD